MKIKVGFIGVGTVATTFAIKLAEDGYPVVAVADSDPELARRMAHRVQGCPVFTASRYRVDEWLPVVYPATVGLFGYRCVNPMASYFCFRRSFSLGRPTAVAVISVPR